MSRLHYHFQTSEHFQQGYNMRLHPVRESGILDFRPGFGEHENSTGVVAGSKAGRPKPLAPLRKLISLNALICAIFMFAGISGAIAAPAQEESKPEVQQMQQKKFASPEDAVKALTDAVSSGDRDAVHALFGPNVTNMMTGDKVQDADNFKSFSQAVTEKCEPEHEGDSKAILNIGKDNWPFPIPLVKQSDGQWMFDTAAGTEEIINRHIGRDELNAIGVCHSFVEAQNLYFSLDPLGDGVHQYAKNFKSSRNKHDGLYWHTEPGTQPSPLGELVEEAHAEGYHGHTNPGTGPQPFHGYFFKILTRQGKDAPGGKLSYVEHRRLIRGFAMVAYPAVWDQSGVMSFIVAKDGQVFQKDLGEKTYKIASHMEDYDPGEGWTVVHDEGIVEK